jgi:hypothetical protein
MKTTKSLFGLLLCVALFISCTKDKEPITGEVIISIDNQSYYNTNDYFVDAAIVLEESDSGTLVSFERRDISLGGSVELGPIELSPGNYYVRYQYYAGNSLSGSKSHKAFQVRLGEETVVNLIR